MKITGYTAAYWRMALYGKTDVCQSFQMPAGMPGPGREYSVFSATLLPIRYYKELLSGSQEEYAVYAKSPFQADKRLVLAASDVSSRYSRRAGPSMSGSLTI